MVNMQQRGNIQNLAFANACVQALFSIPDIDVKQILGMYGIGGNVTGVGRTRQAQSKLTPTQWLTKNPSAPLDTFLAANRGARGRYGTEKALTGLYRNFHKRIPVASRGRGASSNVQTLSA